MAKANGSAQSETSTVDWRSLLDKTPSEYPRPKDIPTGTWRFRAKATKLDDEQGFAQIVAVPLEPISGVDETAYGEVKDQLDDMVAFQRYDLSRMNAVQQLRNLLVAFNLGEVSTRDGVKALKGVDFVAEVTHTPRKDGPGVFVNLRHIGPPQS